MSAPTKGMTMGERVDLFLSENSDFIDVCAELARTFLRATGASRIGMQAVIERARWERSIKLKSDEFKVNNSFEPYLARLVMLVHGDLADCFVTRRADAADEWLAGRPENGDGTFALFSVPDQRGDQR